MFDKQITKEMFGFAGWNFIGASSAVLRDQGGNMLINIFFGPAVNAARGVALSVSHAVTGFVSNFMTALNPQITKSYASGDLDYTFKLVFQGARLSYYILLILALPIIFTTQYLLEIWLGIVPEHTANFARLVLLFAMSESLASPLITVMLATGNIRNYQIVVGGFQLLNLPISYICLRLGCSPDTIFIVAICVSVLCEFTRLFMLRSMIKLRVRAFLKNVYFNVIIVSIIACVVPFWAIQYVVLNNFGTFIFICFVSVLSAVISIYIVGCDKKDRQLIHNVIYKVLKRIR